jgi:hypothetical protein
VIQCGQFAWSCQLLGLPIFCGDGLRQHVTMFFGDWCACGPAFAWGRCVIALRAEQFIGLLPSGIDSRAGLMSVAVAAGKMLSADLGMPVGCFAIAVLGVDCAARATDLKKRRSRSQKRQCARFWHGRYGCRRHDRRREERGAADGQARSVGKRLAGYSEYVQ